MTATERKSDFKLTTSSWASYGVFIMRFSKKIDRLTMAPHCIPLFKVEEGCITFLRRARRIQSQPLSPLSSPRRVLTTGHRHQYPLKPLRCLFLPGTDVTWWRHQMETFSMPLAICAGNSPVTGEFPTQRPVTRSFKVFFDVAWIKGWFMSSIIHVWQRGCWLLPSTSDQPL